jgi:hypothetical protein
MAWKYWGSADAYILKRPAENRLMLEQYLATLEARYVAWCEGAEVGAADGAGSSAPIIRGVIDKYRVWKDRGAESTEGELPTWHEAFLVEQLLARCGSTGDMLTEVELQLAALGTLDPASHSALAAEWSAARDADADVLALRAPGLLAAVIDRVQHENTQRYIIRKLATVYAFRLLMAFLVCLGLALLLVIVELPDQCLGWSVPVSGLALAAAAGLLGAGFSAMMRQRDLGAMTNIEEARTAMGWPMIALRIGVGLGAALILYFFFKAGLTEGVIFPDLEGVGFAHAPPAAALRQQIVDAAAAAESARKLVAEQADQSTAAVLALVDRAVGELLTTLSAIGERAHLQASCGRLVPNAELAKLVVWSFAAGFVETLVPTLLAGVGEKKAPSSEGG